MIGKKHQFAARQTTSMSSREQKPTVSGPASERRRDLLELKSGLTNAKPAIPPSPIPSPPSVKSVITRLPSAPQRKQMQSLPLNSCPLAPFRLPSAESASAPLPHHSQALNLQSLPSPSLLHALNLQSVSVLVVR